MEELPHIQETSPNMHKYQSIRRIEYYIARESQKTTCINMNLLVFNVLLCSGGLNLPSQILSH
jgi:hypothetical protein